MSRARDIASIGSEFGSLATDVEVASAVAEVPTGGKNLIYNGAMQVHQRGTTNGGLTTSGYRTADRWNLNLSSLGTWTQSVEVDAPTGSGLRKSLKMLCTTADATPAAGDQCQVTQLLEGQDLQRIAKGTASAQQITMSFWVKSNVTGTYIAELYDNDNSRSVSASYTVSASATWERKTITFPVDTTGAFDNDNALSLYVVWHLADGSNLTSGTLQTAWAAVTAANRAVGQTNLAAEINNYWQVTGVQLEVGAASTEFEFKSFGQELRECQRYYWRTTATGSSFGVLGLGIATSTTNAVIIVDNPVIMREAPTTIDSDLLSITDGVALISAVSAVTLPAAESTARTVRFNATSTGMTQFRSVILRADSSTSAFLGLSAEL
jgi:hypothetical protein